MSYVLPFDNSVCGETARSVLDKFASTLISVFEQYQMLLKDNINLKNKYEECIKSNNKSPINVDSKESRQNVQITSTRKSDNITNGVCHIKELDVKEGMDCCSNVTDISVDLVDESLSNVTMSDFEVDLEEGSFLSTSTSSRTVSNDELPKKSPIISRIRTRSTPKSKVSRNLERNWLCDATVQKDTDTFANTTVPQKIKIKQKIPLQSLENTTLAADSMKKQNNTSQACKLSFTKAYNVDTTFSSENKKTRQTRLFFAPCKQTIDISTLEDNVTDDTICDETVCESAGRNNEKINSSKLFTKDSNQTFLEDIVQASPRIENHPVSFTNLTKRDEKINSKKSPTKIKDRTFFEDIVQPSPKMGRNPVSLKKHLKLKRKLPNSIKQEKTTDKKESSVKEILKNDDTKGTNELVTPNIKLNISECNNENRMVEHPNLSEDTAQNIDDSDVTFIGDNFLISKNDINSKLVEIINLPDSIDFEDEMVPPASPPRKVSKSSTNHFDRIHEKERKEDSDFDFDFGKAVRKKSERAKLQGFSCWQCEKYYGEMDLSESELKKRKDLCSRHRGKQRIRSDTPEGVCEKEDPRRIQGIHCNSNTKNKSACKSAG